MYTHIMKFPTSQQNAFAIRHAPTPPKICEPKYVKMNLQGQNLHKQLYHGHQCTGAEDDWTKASTSSKSIFLLLASNQKCPPDSTSTIRIFSPQSFWTLVKNRRYRPVVNAKMSPLPQIARMRFMDAEQVCALCLLRILFCAELVKNVVKLAIGVRRGETRI